jgi:hypothetical protein
MAGNSLTYCSLGKDMHPYTARNTGGFLFPCTALVMIYYKEVKYFQCDSLSEPNQHFWPFYRDQLHTLLFDIALSFPNKSLALSL